MAKAKVSPSYKEKKNRIDVSGIRNAQMLNEIDGVCNMKIAYRYRIAVIKDLIDGWREDEDEQEGST